MRMASSVLLLLAVFSAASSAASDFGLADVVEAVVDGEFGGRKCDLLIFGDVLQPPFKELVRGSRRNPMTILSGVDLRSYLRARRRLHLTAWCTVVVTNAPGKMFSRIADVIRYNVHKLSHIYQRSAAVSKGEHDGHRRDQGKGGP